MAVVDPHGLRLRGGWVAHSPQHRGTARADEDVVRHEAMLKMREKEPAQLFLSRIIIQQGLGKRMGNCCVQGFFKSIQNKLSLLVIFSGKGDIAF